MSLFGEAQEAYEARRLAVDEAKVRAGVRAEAEFEAAMAGVRAEQALLDQRVSELKSKRAVSKKAFANQEAMTAKVVFANRIVELLNAGLRKTEFLDAVRSRDWARAQEMLSYATASVEKKATAEKAERVPAVGYVVDRAAGRVTIYPKWKPGRTGLTGPQSIAYMTAHGPFTFFVAESGQKLVSLANAEWLNSDRSDAALGERAVAERKFGNLNSAALAELGAQEFGFKVDSGA